MWFEFLGVVHTIADDE
jgi:threonine dehydrogenase-like Zn-dependent dehydrogenase